MKALLVAAGAMVALLGASGCEGGKPAQAGKTAPAQAVKARPVQEHYPLLFSDERERAHLADYRRTHCNPVVDRPPADPPGPGSDYLAKAVKARDWDKVVDELYDEDGVPPGLSAADRKRVERLRLSIRMTDPAARGDLKAVESLLKAGADPNFQKFSFTGPMHMAAQCDRVEVLKALIAAGGKVDLRSVWEVGDAQYRSTPLMRAVFFGASGSVRVLLDAGADPNLFEEIRALPGPWERRTYVALTFSTTHDIVRMLLDAGADPNLTGGGSTPLMSAAEERDPDKARMLLERGADPAARDSKGKSAAMVAKEVGAPEVLAVLEAPDAVRPKPVVKAP